MTRSETLLLPVSPGEVRAACRSAVLSEVWELEQETADRLVAHEWPWRVSCQVRPTRIEISIDSAGPHGAKVRLEASTAGIGPLPARHLRNHLASLIAAVRRGIEYPLPRPGCRPCG